MKKKIIIGVFSIIFLVILFGVIILIIDNISRPQTLRIISNENIYIKEDIELAMDVVQKELSKDYSSSIVKLIYNGAATIEEQNHYENVLYSSNKNGNLIVIDVVLKKRIYNPFSKYSSEYTISFLLERENDGWTIVNEGKRA